MNISKSPSVTYCWRFVCGSMIYWNTVQIFSRYTRRKSLLFGIDYNLICLHYFLLKFLKKIKRWQGGPGSSVGIATELRAGRSGIEYRWGRGFPPVQTGHGAHPASCKIGTKSFQGVKCGRGVLLTTHHYLVPRTCKGRAIPLPSLWATPGPNGKLYF